MLTSKILCQMQKIHAIRQGAEKRTISAEITTVNYIYSWVQTIYYLKLTKLKKSLSNIHVPNNSEAKIISKSHPQFKLFNWMHIMFANIDILLQLLTVISSLSFFTHFSSFRLQNVERPYLNNQAFSTKQVSRLFN